MREKLNEPVSHTLHSLASEFTTRTERGSEQRLHASCAIKNSTVQQGHGVSYVTRVTLKSAVTFQRQLSSLIYLHASPAFYAVFTQLDSIQSEHQLTSISGMHMCIIQLRISNLLSLNTSGMFKRLETRSFLVFLQMYCSVRHPAM